MLVIVKEYYIEHIHKRWVSNYLQRWFAQLIFSAFNPSYFTSFESAKLSGIVWHCNLFQMSFTHFCVAHNQNDKQPFHSLIILKDRIKQYSVIMIFNNPTIFHLGVFTAGNWHIYKPKWCSMKGAHFHPMSWKSFELHKLQAINHSKL